MAQEVNVRELRNKDFNKLLGIRSRNGVEWEQMEEEFTQLPPIGPLNPNLNTEIKIINDHRDNWTSTALFAAQRVGDDKYCDVHLVADDGHVRVHGVFLKKLSSFLERVIEEGYVPCKDDVTTITLAGVQVDHLKAVISMLYGGNGIINAGDEPHIRSIFEMLQITNIIYDSKRWNSSKKGLRVRCYIEDKAPQSGLHASSTQPTISGSVSNISLASNPRRMEEPRTDISTTAPLPVYQKLTAGSLYRKNPEKRIKRNLVDKSDPSSNSQQEFQTPPSPPPPCPPSPVMEERDLNNGGAKSTILPEEYVKVAPGAHIRFHKQPRIQRNVPGNPAFRSPRPTCESPVEVESDDPDPDSNGPPPKPKRYQEDTEYVPSPAADVVEEEEEEIVDLASGNVERDRGRPETRNRALSRNSSTSEETRRYPKRLRRSDSANADVVGNKSVDGHPEEEEIVDLASGNVERDRGRPETRNRALSRNSSTSEETRRYPKRMRSSDGANADVVGNKSVDGHPEVVADVAVAESSTALAEAPQTRQLRNIVRGDRRDCSQNLPAQPSTANNSLNGPDSLVGAHQCGLCTYSTPEIEGGNELAAHLENSCAKQVVGRFELQRCCNVCDHRFPENSSEEFVNHVKICVTSAKPGHRKKNPLSSDPPTSAENSMPCSKDPTTSTSAAQEQGSVSVGTSIGSVAKKVDSSCTDILTRTNVFVTLDRLIDENIVKLINNVQLRKTPTLTRPKVPKGLAYAIKRGEETVSSQQVEANESSLPSASTAVILPSPPPSVDQPLVTENPKTPKGTKSGNKKKRNKRKGWGHGGKRRKPNLAATSESTDKEQPGPAVSHEANAIIEEDNRESEQPETAVSDENSNIGDVEVTTEANQTEQPVDAAINGRAETTASNEIPNATSTFESFRTPLLPVLDPNPNSDDKRRNEALHDMHADRERCRMKEKLASSLKKIRITRRTGDGVFERTLGNDVSNSSSLGVASSAAVSPGSCAPVSPLLTANNAETSESIANLRQNDSTDQSGQTSEPMNREETLEDVCRTGNVGVSVERQPSPEDLTAVRNAVSTNEKSVQESERSNASGSPADPLINPSTSLTSLPASDPSPAQTLSNPRQSPPSNVSAIDVSNATRHLMPDPSVTSVRAMSMTQIQKQEGEIISFDCQSLEGDSTNVEESGSSSITRVESNHQIQPQNLAPHIPSPSSRQQNQPVNVMNAPAMAPVPQQQTPIPSFLQQPILPVPPPQFRRPRVVVTGQHYYTNTLQTPATVLNTTPTTVEYQSSSSHTVANPANQQRPLINTGSVGQSQQQFQNRANAPLQYLAASQQVQPVQHSQNAQGFITNRPGNLGHQTEFTYYPAASTAANSYQSANYRPMEAAITNRNRPVSVSNNQNHVATVRLPVTANMNPLGGSRTIQSGFQVPTTFNQYQTQQQPHTQMFASQGMQQLQQQNNHFANNNALFTRISVQESHLHQNTPMMASAVDSVGGGQLGNPAPPVSQSGPVRCPNCSLLYGSEKSLREHEREGLCG